MFFQKSLKIQSFICDHALILFESEMCDNMGDMIKAVIKNFDLKSEFIPKYPFVLFSGSFGQNSSIFKTMMRNGKF